MRFQLFCTILIICISTSLFAGQAPDKPQRTWLFVDNYLNLANISQHEKLLQTSRRHNHSYRGSHRNIYRGSRRMFKNNRGAYKRQINRHKNMKTIRKYRGNQYRGKYYRGKYRLLRHRHKYLGNTIILNNRHYKAKRFQHSNRYRLRTNRWINNRYYRWYWPATGIILYQGLSCYISDYGTGEIIDEVCCIESLNICSDDFMVVDS